MIVKVNDSAALTAAGIPFATKTLYKWHHTGQYPKMFIKMGRRLFVDVDMFQKIIEAHRGGN